jgi:cystathionine beta-lyase/cystathionine gamma-synthase
MAAAADFRPRRQDWLEGGEMMSLPLVDLAAQHAAVAEEIAEGWRQMLAKTSFIAGPQVAAFESEYAAFIGVRHCVGVANGTDAIEIALRALGVGPGDDCILPANTFVGDFGISPVSIAEIPHLVERSASRLC